VGQAHRKGVLLAGALTACALAAPPAAVAQTSDLAKPRSSVLIVLDSSRAMGRERLATAKRAIAHAVHGLPRGTPVGLRVYGAKAPASRRGSACTDSQGLVPVTPADSAVMTSEFQRLKPTGLSPVALALSRGAKDLPPTGERTIVLVAGSADSCAPPLPCQTVTLGSAKPPVRVDAIGFEVRAAGRRSLQCAARGTGGVYADAATPDALAPELEAALGRATRDRRSLGRPLAGALDEQHGTPAKPGSYIDSIAPDSERWYHVSIPAGRRLAAAATLVAPPSGDVSAPGSSLSLDAFGSGAQAGALAGSDATATATNLFAFDPSRTITVSIGAQPSAAGNSVRVALHDSPDKQLAQKLHGRSLAVELLFSFVPANGAALPQPDPEAPAAPIVGGTSFNDAAALGGGSFSDALDSGSTVFYKVRLAPGQKLDASASLDVNGLDASLTGTSSLILRLYGPLRGQDAEAQTLGPGDAATHLKSTSAQLGPVKQAGDYYVSAGVNDFLPEGSEPVQLPLSLTLGVGTSSGGLAAPARSGSAGGGTSWAVFAALGAAALALAIGGGLAYRRR
jgi:Ca-activated chloride channel homolog